MGTLESPTTIAPLLLRNLLISVFIYADKSLLNLAEKHRVLQLIRYALVSSFFFFLRLFPSLFPSLNPNFVGNHASKIPQKDTYVPAAVCGGCDSGIARALSQLLSIVNELPVSSRKYEVVRGLAERIMEENERENVEALREVNRNVISAAFSRTLIQLEAAMVEQGPDGVSHDGLDSRPEPVQYQLNRVMKAFRSVGNGALARIGRGKRGVNRSRFSAEKLAAELLWLAQKMAACGFEEEAVKRWASASNMGWLALSAEPRLQGSLVKVTAFLFKQAKNLGVEEDEEGEKEQQKQTKMKLLMSWLPLLCRASTGTDIPVLSMSEKADLEKVLEEIIELLGQEEQEQVLSLWLHHFTSCSFSDWPNLHASYGRWCSASRKFLVLQ
ncbi:hypothetical protein SLE2022_121480 [Rubroshorea leprosula]